MKNIIIILIALMIGGCGITEVVNGEDGKNGANGYSGDDGRNHITPALRPYSWSNDDNLLSFQDVAGSKMQLSSVAFFPTGDNNYLLVRVPAGNQGKEIKAVINGVVSETITVYHDGPDNAVFITGTGTDYAMGVYMDCDKIDKNNHYGYFAWYLDGIQQEFYWTDSFN
jgi:hypothetical protein